MPNSASKGFIDKTCVSVSQSSRFFELAQHLANYQGDDVLAPPAINTAAVAQMRALNAKSASAPNHRLDNSSKNLLLKNTHSPNAAKFDALPDACVLVAITDEAMPRVLLTRRASNLTSHAGEVSFVGGKRDLGDVSSWAVALREACEEVALRAADVQLLGFLPMQISKKGLLVRPVVASINPAAVQYLSPNADEIDKLFWLELDYLCQNAPSEQVFRHQQANQTMALHTPAWAVDLDGDDAPEVVWGLTGRILANLLEIGFGVRYDWYYRLQNCE
ncbi:hypothetical protein B0181_06665 [Moraxella caviae]|uniref:Putative NUDIX hydrolase n=1 Tax=Moraxella caviae TaxID=34060 RepID=A0A1T0A1N0_9GAMM|nr:CoA pyrophosphatase [Moraxella caviae]OOR89643.1 hypothetical protein B0181_06665 [Moraxella caviae]STZ10332.1 putative NUDIX hydrolase [Moraxella caviae]VEW10438.1 putative NUDIX hydrolase [Moraxella caviae]